MPRSSACPAPLTVTTVKPAGTTSKLFGLTEGAHLPARRQYLRWVMFQGTRDENGAWARGTDKLLGEYEARGYPIRTLRSFPNMSIVGFPTLPLIQRLGMGDRLITAPEATPAQHYRWLQLLERHWIGAERGNQVLLHAEGVHRHARAGVVPRHRAGEPAAGALLRGAAEPAGPRTGLRVPAGGGGAGGAVRRNRRRHQRSGAARNDRLRASAVRRRGVPDLARLPGG